MTDKMTVIVTIAVAAVITFGMRALPFVVFRGGRKMPERLLYLGKILPSAIMAVLVVYCLKDVALSWGQESIAQIVAALVVVATYKWKHNTLLSIVLGTLCNMLLLAL